jgi:hypothetical protein
LCFLLYFFLVGSWRVFVSTTAIILAIASVSVLRLYASGSPWLESYRTDNHVLFATGILSDFTPANPTRLGLLNLQLAVYPLLNSRTAANVTALGIGCLLFFVWAVLVFRSRKRWSEALLPLGTISTISLLPIYHRFYDAAVLVLPICWLVWAWRPLKSNLTSWAAVLAAFFAVPGGTVLQSLADKGGALKPISQTWWWNVIVAPHEVWCLSLLSFILLMEMYRQSARAEISPR